jgi:enediyne polyketide synthase
VKLCPNLPGGVAVTNPAIAIVGLGCRYPDAVAPSELWENVLAQRRAFRRMPEERLSRGY